MVEPPINSVVRSEGVFREGDEAGSLAATGAVAGGLLVVGCTLAGIARRRLLDVAPAPRPAMTTTAAASQAVSQWDPRVIERRAAGFLREPAQHI